MVTRKARWHQHARRLDEMEMYKYVNLAEYEMVALVVSVHQGRYGKEENDTVG
jgi:hypothetical protein